MRRVTLTFDDGPGSLTPKVLDALKAHGARAIFFINGMNVDGRDDFKEHMARAAREGHVVASHTYHHLDLTTLTDAQIEAVIRRNEAVIRDITGGSLGIVRPPFGSTDQRVERAINRVGCTQLLWDVDSRDRAGADGEQQRINVVTGVRARGDRDSVVLLHDGSSRSPHEWTLHALEAIIGELSSDGYTFGPWTPLHRWEATYKLDIGSGGSSIGAGWRPHATLSIGSDGVIRVDGEVIHNVSFDAARNLLSWEPGETPGGCNPIGARIGFHRSSETLTPEHRNYYWRGAVPDDTFLIGSVQIDDWADLRGTRC